MVLIIPRLLNFRPSCVNANIFIQKGTLSRLPFTSNKNIKNEGVIVSNRNVAKTISTGSIYFQNKDEPTSEEKKRVKLKKKSSYPRIYTKTGDKGTSALFTGERRVKSDLIFNALGNTDELSSHLGLAREFASKVEPTHPYVDQLLRIQCLLQDVGSCLATPTSSAKKAHIDKVPAFNARHTADLEQWIDEYSKQLPPLENFILPGGGTTSAALHIARSVCRRAERSVQPLIDKEEVDPEVLRYLNRLSDFLFTIARLAARLDNKEETIYTRPTTDTTTKDNTYKPVIAGGSGIEGVWKKPSQ